MFIVFEGTDGVGKTSVMNKVAALLREDIQAGRLVGVPEVVTYVDAGGPDVGGEIRKIIFDLWNAEDATNQPIREARHLLYWAVRWINMHRVALPAIAKGAIVLTDRWIPSTYVYQLIENEVSRQTFFTQADLVLSDCCKALSARGRKMITVNVSAPVPLIIERLQNTRSGQTSVHLDFQDPKRIQDRLRLYKIACRDMMSYGEVLETLNDSTVGACAQNVIQYLKMSMEELWK